MLVDNYLRKALVGGVFLLLFTPFLVSSTMFFPFITGKNFFFRIIVEMLFFGWLILAVRVFEYRPKKSLILYGVLAVTAILTLATIFGDNPYRSFWSNFERMEGLITHLHLAGFFLVLTSVINTRELWRWFFHVSIGVALAIGFVGVLQLSGDIPTFQGQTRLESTFGNATYLAVYLLFHIFITLFYFQKTDTGKAVFSGVSFLIGSVLSIFIIVFRTEILEISDNSKPFAFLILASLVVAICYYIYKTIISNYAKWISWIIYTLLIILDVVILYYTATRGAILGFLGGILLTGLLLGIFSNGKSKKVALSIIGAVFLLVVVFFVAKDSDFVENNQVLKRFASISLTERTVESRFIIWGMSYDGFKEKPVLGYGPENYSIVFNKYYDPGLWRQEAWFDRAHNVVFDRLISGGMLGLLAYLSLFIVAIYCLWGGRMKEDIDIKGRALFTGLLAGYFFQNLFVFDNITSYILFFSVLGYVHSSSNTDSHRLSFVWEKLKSSFSGSSDFHKKAIIPVAILGVFVSIFYLNVDEIRSNKTLLEAIRPRENILTSLDLFKKVFQFNTLSRAEATEQLLQTSSAINTIDSLDSAVKSEFIELSISEMDKRLIEDNNNARLELFYGSYLNAIGRYEDAIVHINRALELSPNKQAIRVELATSYLGLGEPDKALEVLVEIYLLATDFNEALSNMVMVAILNGKDVEIIKDVVLPTRGTTTIIDKRVASAYAKAGKHREALTTWREIVNTGLTRVRENEGDLIDPQDLVSLAASYLNVGDRTNAIKFIEMAIEIAPGFEEQGMFLINEIKAGRKPS